MNPLAQFQQILREHHFTEVSRRKHIKYRNPEGKIIVTASTPSDFRAARNMLVTAKRVIANPVPTSELLEEERQRKELEKQIALPAQARVEPHAAGTGRQRKSHGTGFVYEDKKQPVITEQQREADRLNAEWEKQLASFRRQQRRENADYQKLFRVCVRSLALAMIRRNLAATLNAERKAARRGGWRLLVGAVREANRAFESEHLAGTVRQLLSYELAEADWCMESLDQCACMATDFYLNGCRERLLPWRLGGCSGSGFHPRMRRDLALAAEGEEQWVKEAIESTVTARASHSNLQA